MQVLCTYILCRYYVLYIYCIQVLSQLMSEALGMVTTPYPTSSTSSTSVNKIPVKNQRSDSHDKR